MSVKFLFEFQKTLGTCNCEFNECAEFIFDGLSSECPVGNSGPTCALQSYLDNSEDIKDLFNGNAPPDTPIDLDVISLQRLLDKLIETRYKAEEILTGEPQNVTTLPPITTPNYGQQGRFQSNFSKTISMILSLKN